MDRVHDYSSGPAFLLVRAMARLLFQGRLTLGQDGQLEGDITGPDPLYSYPFRLVRVGRYALLAPMPKERTDSFCACVGTHDRQRATFLPAVFSTPHIPRAHALKAIVDGWDPAQASWPAWTLPERQDFTSAPWAAPLAQLAMGTALRFAQRMHLDTTTARIRVRMEAPTPASTPPVWHPQSFAITQLGSPGYHFDASLQAAFSRACADLLAQYGTTAADCAALNTRTSTTFLGASFVPTPLHSLTAHERMRLIAQAAPVEDHLRDPRLLA